MNRFEDKVVAVTGGASGIGEATVRRFCAEGAKVAFCDWNEARGLEVAAGLEAEGAEVGFEQVDVQHEPEALAFIDNARARFGRLDVLVNNAGIRNYEDITETTAESWDRMLGVNLKGFAFCSKAAVNAMRVGGGGVIVNVASVRSLTAGLRTVQYDTTKAAILGLTRSMARDHAPDNIRVTAVGPGPILTPFHEARAESLEQSREDYIAEFGEGTMLKRPGTPAEVANAILFLASDEASFVTGTCLFVDGGLTAL